MTTLFHFADPVNVENFGLGVFAAPAPCPVATADSAVKEGRASRLPNVNGRGLSGAEWDRINAARNEAWFEAEHAATGTDPEIADQVGRAVGDSTAAELRSILADRPRAVAVPERGVADRHGVYHPSREELSWLASDSAARMIARIHAGLERAAGEAAWYDRVSDADVLLATGCVG